MKNHRYIVRTTLWLARIWGSLILAFVLYFVIIHLIEDQGSGLAGLTETRELISFIFFPILTLVGLAMAYRWEGIGGLVTTTALLFTMIFSGLLDLKFILLIFPPGLLYIAYWFLSRKEKLIARRMKLH